MLGGSSIFRPTTLYEGDMVGVVSIRDRDDR